jgi:hypothetical protein
MMLFLQKYNEKMLNTTVSILGALLIGIEESSDDILIISRALFNRKLLN